MSYKLFACDLDGTLLDDNSNVSKDNFDEYFENLIGWIDFKNLNPIYPGFIKYLDTSLYFMNEGECLVQFQIPFKHKKYE